MWPWQRQQRYGKDIGGRNGNRPQPALFLGVTLILSIGAGALHNRWHADGKTDPLTATVQTAVYPAQVASARTQDALKTIWEAMFSGPRLAQENTQLKTRLAQLEAENEDLRRQAAEVVRLRTALNFTGTTKKPFIAARVIGLLPSPHFDTITLDKGTKDGVKSRAIVRTPVGLVGQVTEAGLASSQVLLLSDVKSKVHGVVCRNGKPMGFYGIVQGTGRTEPLRMIYLKREDDVRAGDTVVSTGFGGVVPPDIPIGTIESVTEETANSLKSAKVMPIVPQPGDLREAYILP